MAMLNWGKLTLMVVDDDQESVDYLCGLIDQLQLDIGAVITETDSLRAYKYLCSHHVDLLFQDVEMPKLSGLSLLKSLDKRPPVILTTSFPEFAMDAYAMGLDECLQKPVELPRLITAIERTMGNKLLGKQPAALSGSFMYLPEAGTSSIVKISFKDVICIHVSHNESLIYLPGTKIVTRKPLQYILSKLPAADFLQVHRSDVVAIAKVIAFNRKSSKMTLMGHDQQIPLSKTYRREFLERVMPDLERDLFLNEPMEK